MKITKEKKIAMELAMAAITTFDEVVNHESEDVNSTFIEAFLAATLVVETKPDFINAIALNRLSRDLEKTNLFIKESE